MKELWKDIPDYNGFYRASNYGRIKSIPRRVFQNGKAKYYPGKILKTRIKNSKRDRYLIVTLCKNGVEKQQKVHRLVLSAFCGECPPGCEGCHTDGNIYNNIIDNLRWDTRKANMQDKIKHGTAQRGENSTNVLLRTSDVLKMRKIYKRGGHTLLEVSRMFGVSESAVKSIIYRHSWAHI